MANQLTQQELADILEKWNDKHIATMQEVTRAVTSLDAIRAGYQKSFWGKLSEHKISILIVIGAASLIAVSKLTACGTSASYGDFAYSKSCASQVTQP